MATSVRKAPTRGRWLCSKVISFIVEECWWVKAGCSQQPTAKWGRFCKGRQGKSLLGPCLCPHPPLSFCSVFLSVCISAPFFGSLFFLCVLLSGLLTQLFLSLSLSSFSFASSPLLLSPLSLLLFLFPLPSSSLLLLPSFLLPPSCHLSHSLPSSLLPPSLSVTLFSQSVHGASGQ